MDYLVRLFRALANARRLDIIRYVVEHPDSTVSHIATALSLPVHDASRHLKRLFEVAVLDGRPSGRYVLSSAPGPDSARHPVLREVRRLLKSHFAPDRLAGASESVGLDSNGATWEEVYQAMCFEFTTFTHLRRLLILRLLCCHGPRPFAEIVKEIGMSEMAARRHLAKLSRRGLIAGDAIGRGQPVSLKQPLDTKFRSQLFNCVAAYFREGAN